MTIEIVDLPIKNMVISHSFLYVYQRVSFFGTVFEPPISSDLLRMVFDWVNPTLVHVNHSTISGWWFQTFIFNFP